MYNKFITVKMGVGYYGKGPNDHTHFCRKSSVSKYPGRTGYALLVLLVFYLETAQQLKEH